MKYKNQESIMAGPCLFCNKDGENFGKSILYKVTDFNERFEKITDVHLDGLLVEKIKEGNLDFILEKKDNFDVYLCSSCSKKNKNKLTKAVRIKGIKYIIFFLITSGFVISSFMGVIEIGMLIKVLVSLLAVYFLASGLGQITTKITDKDSQMHYALAQKVGDGDYFSICQFKDLVERCQLSISESNLLTKNDLFCYTQEIIKKYDGICFETPTIRENSIKGMAKLPQFTNANTPDNVEVNNDNYQFRNIKFKYREKVEY